MPVASGQKIGPYEITSQIGAGGMGEVYRARDPRLGRDVAIKVLPASFSSDADRLQRFAQEARAAAALNHPNILAIYDIGDDHGAPYIVSELLEGETLRQRLRSGPLSIRRAIDFATQIVRGLAAAHERNIVHRDLKPENIFITNDGRVKILDFGLAKLTRPEESGGGDAATVQVATEPGIVMGTVGYMSPEQVRGKAADHRSDLFAFGAILYEMLSGKRAFHGDTPADTMSAILKDDPPELSETARNAPPALERIVRHCLEKNPGQRFQSAGDVAFNLEALSEITITSRPGVPAIRAAASPRRFALPILAALLVGASYLGIYYAGKGSRLSASPRFHRVTFRRGTIESARFAPDGQTILYGASLEGKPVEIFTTRYDSTDSRPLGLGNAEIFSISSSGELAIGAGARPLAAFMQTGTLSRVPLAGGAPRPVLEKVVSADWTPDGSDIAVVREKPSGYTYLEFPVGRPIYDPIGWVTHVRFSPRGDRLAFADHVRGGDDGRVVIIDRDAKHVISSRFYTTVEGVAWAPSGKEVWFAASPSGAARAIYALDLSGHEREVLRVPGTLTLLDISRDGRVLLTLDNSQFGIMALTPGEKSERDLSWFDWSIVNDISRDGKVIVFSETGEAVGANYSSYLRATDGSPAVRLGEGATPKLSPDGKWVVTPTLSTPAQIALLPTGAGQAKNLTTDSMAHFDVAWTPDGKAIIFNAVAANEAPRTYWMEFPNGKPRPITPPGVTGVLVTPDDKYLLASDSERNFSLYPVQGGDPQPFNPALDRKEQPLYWEPDGKALVVGTFEVPQKILRIHLGSDKRELVQQIAPADLTGVKDISGTVFSTDRKAYAYSYMRVLSVLYVVDGLK